MKIAALAGGTGAAKLLRGIAAVNDPAELTVIVNTADDWECWGLRVSPDLDSVAYALAGRLNRELGWGLRGDTFRCLEAMAEFGEIPWFNLGDQDLATHIFRTKGIRQGQRLSAITDQIRRSLKLPTRLLPMTDDRVATRVRTPQGWLDFQEYYVRERGQLEVLEVRYEGLESAAPLPAALAAIRQAELVLVCCSDPICSIGPIVSQEGFRQALLETPAPVVAVTPIVGNAMVAGPAAHFMRAKGYPVSCLGLAQWYGAWLDTLVIDRQDRAERAAIQALGIAVHEADVVMPDAAAEAALAREVIACAAHAKRTR